MLAFVFAPIGACVGTFFLRHVNTLGTIGADALSALVFDRSRGVPKSRVAPR